MLYPYQEQGFCVYVEFTGMAGAYRTVRAMDQYVERCYLLHKMHVSWACCTRALLL